MKILIAFALILSVSSVFAQRVRENVKVRQASLEAPQQDTKEQPVKKVKKVKKGVSKL